MNTEISQKFSPRAWGWSGCSGPDFCSFFVLPTRVGMVRERCFPLRDSAGSPHARGDGPEIAATRKAYLMFSPRAWGWSDNDDDDDDNDGNVLPTRVGMVRLCPLAATTHESSPHARGDGPSRT